MNKIYFGVLFPVFLIVSSLHSMEGPPPSKFAQYVKFDANFETFQGLTTEGLDELKRIRDALRRRQKDFNAKLRGLDSVHHAIEVARVAKFHLFLYGGPGGAKTGVATWLCKGECNKTFQKQLNEMTTELELVGGLDFEKAKLGIPEYNTKGSMIDFAVAMLDEAEKANPAVMQVLLSILNERMFFAGKEQMPAATETALLTSNLDLPKFFRYFFQSGRGPTAAALLNRIQFKVFMHNWLQKEDQVALLKLANEKRKLRVLKQVNPGLAEAHHLEQRIDTIDWETLRSFTDTLIKVNNSFLTHYIILMNKMHDETSRVITESAERHKTDPSAEPFPYFPSFDYTTRNLLNGVTDGVYASAFIDFLLSDLANDDKIENWTRKPIVLGPLSLWRAYLSLTTIGPGKTKLDHTKDGEPSLNIHFDFKVDEASLRDRDERANIANLKSEQDRFKRIFGGILVEAQKAIRDAAPLALTPDTQNDSFDQFERLLLKK